MTPNEKRASFIAEARAYADQHERWCAPCTWYVCDWANSHEAERHVLALWDELQRIEALLNTPETLDFGKAVVLEAAHQRERWGEEDRAKKSDADWFWLIGYLAGKAIRPNNEKLLHHIITIAAACANWHRNRMPKAESCEGIKNGLRCSSCVSGGRACKTKPKPCAMCDDSRCDEKDEERS